MLLTFSDGTPFATGATNYLYRPAHQWESTPRILVPVQFEGISVIAVVDTGAPFVVCTPEIARQAGLEPTEGQLATELHWHGRHMGYLFRRYITLRADQGNDALVDATIFVPNVESAPAWDAGRRPFVLGMGCLERMRFAIDPNNDTFYFGRLQPSDDL